jgi:hypothetical protein
MGPQPKTAAATAGSAENGPDRFCYSTKSIFVRDETPLKQRRGNIALLTTGIDP